MNQPELDPRRFEATIHTTPVLTERELRYLPVIDSETLRELVGHELKSDKSFTEIEQRPRLVEGPEGLALSCLVIRVSDSTDWEAPALPISGGSFQPDSYTHLTKQQFMLRAIRSSLYFANDQVPPHELLIPRNKT